MLSCKDFFLDYNKKLSDVLKNYHYDEIEKITKFLEINIKTKKKNFCLWKRWFSLYSKSFSL